VKKTLIVFRLFCLKPVEIETDLHSSFKLYRDLLLLFSTVVDDANVVYIVL